MKIKERRLSVLLQKAYPLPWDARRAAAVDFAVRAYRSARRLQPMHPFWMLAVIGRCISLPFWAGQILLLLAMVGIGGEREAVIVGAPMVALIGFGELVRAFSCGMWELEQTCRCHLRRLLLARFAITGAVDLAVLLTANALQGGEIPALRGAVYSVTVFTLTNLICFWLFALVPQGSVRLAAVGGLSGICLLMLQFRDPVGGGFDPFAPHFFARWLILLALSAFLLSLAVRRYILKEESKWIVMQQR